MWGGDLIIRRQRARGHRTSIYPSPRRRSGSTPASARSLAKALVNIAVSCVETCVGAGLRRDDGGGEATSSTAGSAIEDIEPRSTCHPDEGRGLRQVQRALLVEELVTIAVSCVETCVGPGLRRDDGCGEAGLRLALKPEIVIEPFLETLEVSGFQFPRMPINECLRVGAEASCGDENCLRCSFVAFDTP